MKICRKKHVELLLVLREAPRVFSTKLNSRGKELKQQEKTKLKKKRKNGCIKNPMELLSTPIKVPWVCGLKIL